MSTLGYYNRLDRSALDIAKLALEESSRIIKNGYVLVRKTSDGSQPTYDVRHYNAIVEIPNYFKGKVFDVEKELL